MFARIFAAIRRAAGRVWDGAKHLVAGRIWPTIKRAAGAVKNFAAHAAPKVWVGIKRVAATGGIALIVTSVVALIGGLLVVLHRRFVRKHGVLPATYYNMKAEQNTGLKKVWYKIRAGLGAAWSFTVIGLLYVWLWVKSAIRVVFAIPRRIGRFVTSPFRKKTAESGGAATQKTAGEHSSDSVASESAPVDEETQAQAMSVAHHTADVVGDGVLKKHPELGEYVPGIKMSVRSHLMDAWEAQRASFSSLNMDEVVAHAGGVEGLVDKVISEFSQAESESSRLTDFANADWSGHNPFMNYGVCTVFRNKSGRKYEEPLKHIVQSYDAATIRNYLAESRNAGITNKHGASMTVGHWGDMARYETRSKLESHSAWKRLRKKTPEPMVESISRLVVERAVLINILTEMPVGKCLDLAVRFTESDPTFQEMMDAHSGEGKAA